MSSVSLELERDVANFVRLPPKKRAELFINLLSCQKLLLALVSDKMDLADLTKDQVTGMIIGMHDQMDKALSGQGLIL